MTCGGSGGAGDSTAEGEDCGGLELRTECEFAAEFESTRAGAGVDAVGLRAIEQEHERRGEGPHEEGAGGVDEVWRHRDADVGGDAGRGMARWQDGFQLAAATDGPGGSERPYPRPDWERWRGDFGLYFIGSEGESGAEAVGVAVSRIESAAGDIERVDQAAEVDGASTGGDAVLVLNAEQVAGCERARAAEGLPEGVREPGEGRMGHWGSQSMPQ
jgi:hypothetical protein